MSKPKAQNPIRVQSSGSARLLNRYLAYVTYKIFNTKGSIKQNVPIKEWHEYQIQWLNIEADLKGLFTNPFRLLRPIAMSLAAFWFIAKGNHDAAVHTAFIVGAITAGTKGGANSATVVVSTLVTTTKIIAMPGVHQGTVSGVTLNSVAITKIVGSATPFNETAELWYKDNPGSLTSVNLTTSTSGGSGPMIGYLNLEGTKDGTPDVTATANGDSSGAAVSITPSVDNCCVVASVYSEANISSVGAGETSAFSVQAQSFENLAGSYNIQTTAGAESMDFTLGFGARWAVAAAAIRAAGSSPSLSQSPSASLSPSSSASASRSPSASSSASVSPSASRSPSASSSASISPSASASPSASISPSSSASASTSPSASVSPSSSSSPSSSASASLSPSASVSPSASASPSAQIPLMMMGIGS